MSVLYCLISTVIVVWSQREKIYFVYDCLRSIIADNTFLGELDLLVIKEIMYNFFRTWYLKSYKWCSLFLFLLNGKPKCGYWYPNIYVRWINIFIFLQSIFILHSNINNKYTQHALISLMWLKNTYLQINIWLPDCHWTD